MTTKPLIDVINHELSGLAHTDPDLKTYILEITSHEYANRVDTNDLLHEILAELRQGREVWTHKWEEYIAEQNRRWEQQSTWWEEQNRKLYDNQKELNRLHEEVVAQGKRLDCSIDAKNAQWNIKSEEAFRNSLARILEQSFSVKVLNIVEYDEYGEVFGRPEQIELVIVVKSRLLLICELKSSIDESGMYIFERKARFYEHLHKHLANRLLVISPLVDAKAKQVASSLGIEVYSDPLDIKSI